MSQSNITMAFRKRLKKFKYEDIHIKLIDRDKNVYNVVAIEPLSKSKVSVSLSESEMYTMLR